MSTNNKQLLSNLLTHQHIVWLIAIVMCPALGLLTFKLNSLLVLSAVILLALLVLMFVRPEAATLAVFFVLYTNIAVVAKHFHGVPHFVAASFGLLLFLPLLNYIFVKRQKWIIDYTFLLMLIFLVVVISSSFFAKNMNLAVLWIVTYLVEGLVLYLLIINVVRNAATLRRVIWVLMLACAMLGSMTLYQEVTGSYHQTFGGLAQRHNEGDDELLQTRTKERAWNRAGGPIGSVNRYGQIMIVVLPLALFRFWDERSLKLRALAAAATLLILSGVLLTYSRSSFLTLLFLLVIMTLMRYIRLHQVLITAAVFIIMITFAAPNYLMRMESLRGVQGLFSKKTSARPDAITRGRVTEMLAALNVFLDYPILGVGPGQYTKYYSVEYMNDPDIALRRIAKNRRAHTLYFELAAETGLIGIISFMAIVLTLMYQLWQARRRWLQSRPDMANMATAFLLSITAYLSTGVFAHFSYQRYYWLLLALAGAAIQIFRSETSDNEAPRQVSLEKTNMINQPSHSNCFESAIKISSDAKVKRS